MRKKVCQFSIAFSLLLLLWLEVTSVWAASPITTPEQIVLSLTGNSAQMGVTWCDEENASGAEVTYSANSDLSGAQTVSAGETATGSGYQYFEATMTGLAPGQTYYYQVGIPGKMSTTKSFTTGSGSSDYDFLYLGDVQYNSGTMGSDYDAWKNLLQNAVASHPSASFIMQGGDLVNLGQNQEEWQALLTRTEDIFSKVPLMSVAGNHESNDVSGKPKLYAGIFELPQNGPSGFKEEFYSYDYGDSHITCLNSNIFSDEQLNAGIMEKSDFDRIKTWIANDLSGSTKKYKIIVLHHPAYIVASDAVSAKVLSEWVPIFEDNGVSLVLCGHQHLYMRTFPMFDQERNEASGITYLMGNSGNKFYPGADIAYDASMIENTSTYQLLNVANSGITITTYNAAGAELDAVVVTKPVAADRKISLDYDTAIATVSAPALKVPGSAVTVGVSKLLAGKKVDSVSVTDKNGKTYEVTTVKANESYSFVMPNRSVTVKLLFKDNIAGGDPTGIYYSYSVSTNDDPIWSISVDSSGADGNGKISSGSLVTVTVTREEEAFGASLNGLKVTCNGSAIPASGLSTTKGSYNTIKGGKYQFTMPEGNVTISPEAYYTGLNVYARESNSGAYDLVEAFSREDLTELAQSNGYYTGYDSYPTAVIGKANQYVNLESLLSNCGIELTTSSSITFKAIDGASYTCSYDELFGTARYYYPNIDSGSASGKKTIKPMLVIKGYQARCMGIPSGKTIDDMIPDTRDAYRLAFGQTEDEFNGGTPSLKEVTVKNFLKWTNSIQISGIKKSVVIPTTTSGGSVTVVQQTAVVDADGKATVVLVEDAIKKSLSEVITASKNGNLTPELKIDVLKLESAKSVEVAVPLSLMKELTAPEKLLLNISTQFGNIGLDTETLKVIQKVNTKEDIKIAITPVARSKIQNTDGRELTDSIINITITTGNQNITEFGDGKIEILLPFTPDTTKKAKGYYVVCLTADGKGQRMSGSVYSSQDKAMKFETTHLSSFAVAYTTNTAVNVFDDVGEDAWYVPYATFVTEKEFFQGTGKTTFGPNDTMTRAMLVTVLGRASGAETKTVTGSAFGDVSSTSWYGPYVQWANMNGIISGVGDGRFAPDQPVTREQLAVMLCQCAGLVDGTTQAAIKGELQAYTDAGSISLWAQSEMAWACRSGLIHGRTEDVLAPKDTATRAEVAAIIARYADLIKK